jgi:flagellar biosynthesis chaperone FliJ
MKHTDELAQLLRLRRLREDAARLDCQRRREARDAAQAAVTAREAEVARLRNQRHSLVQRAGHEHAPAMPRLGIFTSTRREMLDDLLERAEYALIDDEESLTEAQDALDAAQAAWQREMARCEAMQMLRDRVQRDSRLVDAARAERELDASRRVAGWEAMQ